MEVKCTSCQQVTVFEQPHPYHAGFSNVGFLYNDAGDRTLVWEGYDPAWERIAGKRPPWVLTATDWPAIEGFLAPAPDGGRWRFKNPGRCARCRNVIARSLADGEIYYLLFPGSLRLELGSFDRALADPAA